MYIVQLNLYLKIKLSFLYFLKIAFVDECKHIRHDVRVPKSTSKMVQGFILLKNSHRSDFKWGHCSSVFLKNEFLR
jgi:hypothetical protein